MSLIQRKIGKILRKTSIHYAHTNQKKMFIIYINKYITKFTKFLTVNEKEHPELIEFIIANRENITEFMSYSRVFRADIVDTLLKYYCSNNPMKNTRNIYYHDSYESVRDNVDTTIRKNMTALNPNIIQSNIVVQLFLTNICCFSSSLRQGFVLSDVTAKTKTTEHWVERIPPLLFISFTILFMKLYIVFYNFRGEVAPILVVDVMVTIIACVSALILVYLRVPQAICADAKRSASDTYIKFKIDLHLDFLNKSSESTRKKYFQNMEREFARVSSDGYDSLDNSSFIC